MAKSDWWFQFEHLKWMTDENLNRCSLATQGFWIRCICMMRKSDTFELAGTVKELSRLLNVFPDEFIECVTELKNTKTADVTLCNAENVTCNDHVTLLSRRIKNELSTKEQTRLRVARHRRNAECNAPVTAHSKSNNNNKSKKEEKRESEPKRSPAPKEVDKAKRGSRIDPSFSLSTEMTEWARSNVPTIDLSTETQNFVDYWLAVPGAKGVKLDWTATWRKWMRNQLKYEKQNGQNRQANTKLTDAEVIRASAEQFTRAYGSPAIRSTGDMDNSKQDSEVKRLGHENI